MLKIFKKHKLAFTLIELLVVVVIIGIITTIAVTSLNTSRARTRDAKRVSDIKQIQTALELYYSDYEEYPTTLGDSISSGTKIYLASVPTAPTPVDGDCSDTNNSYTYEVQGSTNGSYSISFCLGNSVGEILSGVNLAIPGEITSPTYAWQNVGTAGFSTGMAYYYVSVVIYNGVPYITYMDYTESVLIESAVSVVMKYNGSDWETVNITDFSQPLMPFLFNYDGDLYITYADGAYSNKATVRKFNGTTWDLIGNPGFSTGPAEGFYLTIDNEIPYVAYQDADNNFKSTIMKYNGSGWETVTVADFSSETNLCYVSIYDGISYATCIDSSNENKVTVMKFDGSNWTTIGNTGFLSSSNLVSAIYEGTLYIAFTDSVNNSKLSVVKFNGTSWDYVGTAGFSAGEVPYLFYSSLFFYNGTLYISYIDGGNSNKATVMKFNGTDWIGVGNPGFSAGEILLTSLFVYNNIPYVAYMDGGNSGKATVMKYDVN